LHEGGAAEMTRGVREAVASLVRGLASRAEVEVEDVLECTIVGNPIMHHLLLGLDPPPLGSAPFALATDAAVRVRARELELPAHEGARVYVLPCIAGHVGADAAGAILAETPYLADEITLLVDVGTNAEIVLGSRDRLLAASSPTGPAFEGAQISSGQRAAPGAIERVRVDKDTLEPRFRVIGSSRWSDETGFAASRPSIGSSSRARSGARSIRCMPSCSGSCQMRRWTASARLATRPGPARSSRCSRARLATRSSGSCAPSKRSRRRSSPASRSISS